MYQEVNTELDAEINKKEKENSVLHIGTKENEKLLQHYVQGPMVGHKADSGETAKGEMPKEQYKNNV